MNARPLYPQGAPCSACGAGDQCVNQSLCCADKCDEDGVEGDSGKVPKEIGLVGGVLALSVVVCAFL